MEKIAKLGLAALAAASLSLTACLQGTEPDTTPAFSTQELESLATCKVTGGFGACAGPGTCTVFYQTESGTVWPQVGDLDSADFGKTEPACLKAADSTLYAKVYGK